MISFFGILVYLIIAGVVIVNLLFLHNTVAVIAAAFVFVFPVVPLLLHRYAMGKIKITVDERNNNTELGYDRPVYVTIANPTFVPVISFNFTLSLKNGFYSVVDKYEYGIPVYPKQTLKLVLTEPIFEFCGIYDMKIDKINSWDFMHFYSFPQKQVYTKKISVLPKKCGKTDISPERFISENSDTEESNKKGSDYPEVKNIREYIPGDSLKNIHWKLSSKKNALMVKEQISLASDNAVVILELTNTENRMLENILNMAYTLLSEWAKSNVSFTLWWWSEALKEMRNAKVNTEADLDDCFLTLMTDMSYTEYDKGLSNFAYTTSVADKAVWINGVGGDNVVFEFVESNEENDEKKDKAKKSKSGFKFGKFKFMGKNKVNKKDDDKKCLAYISYVEF